MRAASHSAAGQLWTDSCSPNYRAKNWIFWIAKQHPKWHLTWHIPGERAVDIRPKESIRILDRSDSVAIVECSVDFQHGNVAGHQLLVVRMHGDLVDGVSLAIWRLCSQLIRSGQYGQFLGLVVDDTVRGGYHTVFGHNRSAAVVRELLAAGGEEAEHGFGHQHLQRYLVRIGSRCFLAADDPRLDICERKRFFQNRKVN